MVLRYCLKCGEAMERRKLVNDFYEEGKDVFTNYTFYGYCVNEDCPRAYLLAVGGYDKKPRKKRK